MRRGDLVVAAFAGDFGKPRPALVIQANPFNDTHATVTLLPVTSALHDAPLYRVPLQPSAGNGLVSESQVMVDKAATVSRSKIAKVIGALEPEPLIQVERALATWLGIA